MYVNPTKSIKQTILGSAILDSIFSIDIDILFDFVTYITALIEKLQERKKSAFLEGNRPSTVDFFSLSQILIYNSLI